MPITNPNYSQLNHEEMAASIGLKVKHIPLLIASYLEEAGTITQNIESAIANKDYDAIRAAAHSIKGSSGNLQFTDIYDMSREMEFAATENSDTFDYSAYIRAIKDAISTIKL